MEHNRVRLPIVQDHYPDLVNQMALDGGRVFNNESLENAFIDRRIREAANVVAVRNEIYELFKGFYRFLSGHGFLNMP